MLARSQFEFAERLFGVGTSEPLFKGFPIVPAPWPRAGRKKSGSVYDKDLISSSLRGGPNIEAVDPRYLHATQPSVLQEHVNYYMGDEYERTGRTARDQDVNINQVPHVYIRPGSRADILSGHHRATAHLLQGRQFFAHVIRETE